MNFIIKKLFFLILITYSNCEYNQLDWSLCGPTDLEIIEKSLTPMPIVFPNPVEWKLKALLKRPVDGPLIGNVTIVRTLLGIQLPIRCYLVGGQWVGSCVYPDLCQSLMYVANFDKDNCPTGFVQNGVNCKCPFNLLPGTIELNSIVQTYSPVFLSNPWLMSGDYKITIKASDSRGYFFCLNLGFTIKS